MRRRLTIAELVARTGEPLEVLERWRSLGLLGTRTGDGYGYEAIERIRLVQMFRQRGIDAEQVAGSLRDGYLSTVIDSYLDDLLPGEGRPAYSLEEVAQKVGLDLALLRRIWEAVSLSRQDDVLSRDDVEFLSTCKVVYEAGFPEEALLQLLRVWADTLQRAAEATNRLFHFYVHELDPGESAIPNPSSSLSPDRLRPLLEPSILYFLRKGMVEWLPEDMVLHLQEEVGLRSRATVPGQVEAAVLFVDLSSFTPLAEAMGDLKAAEILEKFSALVRESSARWDGHIVKQIGDSFMVVFHSPQTAVAAALEIEKKASAEPQFPAVRSGIHWGPLLYREGDYVGATVNVAARLAAAAGRHQVLVSDAARKGAKGLPGCEFERLGRRSLKGVSEDVELFEARAGGGRADDHAVDPVCGMELGPSEVAARLSLGGREQRFCSQECLRRFVAAPERFVSVPPKG